MSNYVVDIYAKDGTIQSLYPDIGFSYTKKLNENNEGKFDYSSTTPLLRTLATTGAYMIVFKDGAIDYAGEIIGNAKLDGGGISIRTQGWEVKMANDSGSYSNSPYSTTASATIAGDIITESPATAGTIEAGTDLDFRISETTTFQSALENLRRKTAQDIWYDYTAYPNVEVNLVNHQGSSTSRYTFNDGMDIRNIDYSTSKPKGNKILVFGKGDGENQIKSEYPSHGYDATSQSNNGVILWIERDPTVVSVTEANKLADALVAAYKDEIKYYWFEINDPSTDLTEGDVITINSADKDLVDEEVRVTGIQRSISKNQEILTVQVTNKEHSELLTKRDKLLGKIQSNQSNSDTYMQGTTNILTFSEMINADSTAPLRVKAYLEEAFIKDEVGNLRVNSFTLDYDVDPFRSGVGTASEDDVAPTVSGTSSSTQPGVSGTSSSTQPGVAGDSGNFNSYSYVGGDNTSTISCSSGSWTTVASVRPGSSYLNQSLYANIWIMGESGGAEDIEVRIGNDAVYGYIEPGVVGSGATVWGTYTDGFRDTSMLMSGDIGCGGVTSSLHDIFVQVRPQTGAISLACGMSLYTIRHNHDDGTYSADNHGHADGSYSADNHGHGDGSYGAASHNHNVSIGDGVSDAGSLNATSVDIYIDFWNGSSWVNKHSILSTGKTIDYNVDISNGGTLPDAPGFWRARIYTNNANADLIQGTIKCKHELDA